MKLLITDDDRQIREGIVEGIDWNSIGINEVRSASNGVEALEIFNAFSPEIVVTDIRMPGVDGLELLKEVKRQKPSSKVIIISGYADFEYAKTAISFGAMDYILKPIRTRSLISLIMQARESVNNEKRMKKNLRNINVFTRPNSWRMFWPAILRIDALFLTV
jgi:two-component system response regulator YesN